MPQSFENARGEVMVLPRGLHVAGFDRRAVVTLARGGLGHAVVRRTLDPARGSLEGVLTGRTYAEAQARLDALLAFLHHQPLRFRRHTFADSYLEVWTEGLADDGTTVGKAAQVRVPLVAPDPLWVGVDASYPDAGMHTLTAESEAVSVVNAGTAPTSVTVTVTSDGAAHLPMIENLTTGQSARYNAALLDGQELVVDGRAHTATRDGHLVTDLMSNLFLIGGLHLAPGANELLLSQLPASTGSLWRLEWVERHY